MQMLEFSHFELDQPHNFYVINHIFTIRTFIMLLSSIDAVLFLGRD